ncbi:MAG: hypothetical protein JSW09_02660 [Pseudomonadota bacterium]|nr:MAG: hypothetical protein JSW09_02660 [Pseudomonadota bacterium]
MNLANAVHLPESGSESTPSDVDEITAMVYGGDIYAVQVVSAAVQLITSTTSAATPIPHDSVWPFIR